MILTGAAALLVLAFGGGEAARMQYAQSGSISIEQRIIVRIPRARPQRGAASPARRIVTWREGRGPRCISARNITGVGMIGENNVDLVLRDSSRVRARLNGRCPALDFYRGFYVTATEEGRICADRDVIRSRAGAECEIEQFRSLRPAAQ